MTFDLEERSREFCKQVVLYCRKLPRTISNQEFVRQLVRSSGSVGANYIEANESLSKKDFQHRIKISRKEAKESCHWLRLLVDTNEAQFISDGQRLLAEATELKKILSAILQK